MTRTRQSRSFRTAFSFRDRTLVVDLGRPRRVISSAVRGGGIVKVRYLLNHEVPANPCASPHPQRSWPDPSRYLARVAARLGITEKVVGLMTAVDVRNVVTVREAYRPIWVEAWVTVGVTNAVHAGRVRNPKTGRSCSSGPGTINIILVTNARLSAAAMVGAVQVATESKTAVLLERRVPSATGASLATGTGTDVTVVGGGAGPYIRYSGTHTPIGAMIGRAVRRAVERGLKRALAER